MKLLKQKKNVKLIGHCEQSEAILSRLPRRDAPRNDRIILSPATLSSSGLTGALLAVALFLAIPAGAYTSCVGGTEITRNKYGASGAPGTCTAATCPSETKTFCKSDKPMNWWSAFNWCRSNEGTLADFGAMCPGVAMVTKNVSGACPGLQRTGGGECVWSSLGKGGASAFYVALDNATVYTRTRNNDTCYAFCE